jgi:hypothetical protein
MTIRFTVIISAPITPMIPIDARKGQKYMQLSITLMTTHIIVQMRTKCPLAAILQINKYIIERKDATRETTPNTNAPKTTYNMIVQINGSEINAPTIRRSSDEYAQKIRSSAIMLTIANAMFRNTFI